MQEIKGSLATPLYVLKEAACAADHVDSIKDIKDTF